MEIFYVGWSATLGTAYLKFQVNLTIIFPAAMNGFQGSDFVNPCVGLTLMYAADLSF